MDRFVGKRLDGRYEIQEIIGVGGMAVVYKAHDNVENRTVAIKILKEEFVSNEEFIRRFKNESKAIAVLSHPNIVKVYDVSFGDLIQYIVMEYIDGITLKELIERQGSLRWKDAVYFMVQILKALQHAHDKGIVHRDVKPQNIMVLSDGTIKVADFGIARFARNEQRTITDKAIGSVHYISPEQARGEKTDEKADIYSVGVMLYEMLTGQLPFDAESAVSVAIMQLQRDPKLPTEINPAVPLGLEQITMHAMQKTIERRYQSASEMLCDLEQFKKDPESTFDYSYFVDNAPTKFVDSIMSSTPASAVVIEEEEEEIEEVKERNNMIPILAGVASALVIVLIILGIKFIPKLLKNTGKEYECPDFINMTIENVEKHEFYKENIFEFKFEYIESEYDINRVCDQSTPAGKKLKKGTTITLYISEGQTTVPIPDVFNMNEDKAISKLKAEGFIVATKEQKHEEVEVGKVIKTDPAIGTKAPAKSKITVYVSSGKPEKYVQVPDVVGFSKEDAISDLENADLSYEIEERNLTPDEEFDKGYVIAQSPEGGENSNEVLEGTVVKLYVSTGKVDYTYKPVVELPNDAPLSKGYVSIWKKDGKDPIAETKEEIDLTKKMYTFDELTTNDKEVKYIAKVRFAEDSSKKYYVFAEVTFNVVNNKYDSKAYYDYHNYVPAPELCEKCGLELEAEHECPTCTNCGEKLKKDVVIDGKEHKCECKTCLNSFIYGKKHVCKCIHCGEKEFGPNHTDECECGIELKPTDVHCKECHSNIKGEHEHINCPNPDGEKPEHLKPDDSNVVCGICGYKENE